MAANTVAAMWQTEWMKVSDIMTLQRSSPSSWIKWTSVKKWGTVLDANIFIPSDTRQTGNCPPGIPPPFSVRCVFPFAGGPARYGCCRSTRQGDDVGWIFVLSTAPNFLLTLKWNGWWGLYAITSLLWFLLFYTRHLWCRRHLVSWFGTFWKK